jgi:hypothetical protein
MKNNEALAQIKMNELIRAGVEAQRVQRALAERRQGRSQSGDKRAQVSMPGSRQASAGRQPGWLSVVFGWLGIFRTV